MLNSVGRYAGSMILNIYQHYVSMGSTSAWGINEHFFILQKKLIKYEKQQLNLTNIVIILIIFNFSDMMKFLFFNLNIFMNFYIYKFLYLTYSDLKKKNGSLKILKEFILKKKLVDIFS